MVTKALSTLSPKTATVAEFGDICLFYDSRFVAEIGDYSRQCRQAITVVSGVLRLADADRTARSRPIRSAIGRLSVCGLSVCDTVHCS